MSKTEAAEADRAGGPGDLQLAEAVARAAGERLREGVRGYREVFFENAKDVKLEADFASERLIRERLSAASPHPVIGEELGGDASLLDQDSPYWVVDPLDGTLNYQKDLPMACVSIGLWRGREPLAGVVYDFYRDELIAGGAGPGGALTVGGRAHRPGWAETVGEAALATGFPAGRDYGTDALLGFVASVQRYKKVRMIGSAALAVAYVATGRVDAYREECVNLWDVAAGLALVRAAGGVFRADPMPGRPFSLDVRAAGHEGLMPV